MSSDILPVVSGTVASQTTLSNADLTPFSAAVISDANAGATETLTITLSGGGGSLVDGIGMHGLVANADGSYTLSGSAPAVTKELQALDFVPVAIAAGMQAITSFTLIDRTSALSTTYHNSTPVLLANFNADTGLAPEGTLVADQAGDFFGVTYNGGRDSDGAVYELAKTATGYKLTTIASFDETTGTNPQSGLMIDAAGNLFGTNVLGGISNSGTVYELVKNVAGYSAPVLLTNFGPSSGSEPTGGLVADSAGDLFGTTYSPGLLFEIPKTASGYGTEETIVQLNEKFETGPQSKLLIDPDGNIFGTSGIGTINSKIFEVTKTSSGYALPITLANFDGEGAQGSLIMDAAGDLFGTTQVGGADNDGTVFELVKSASGYSTPVTLASFNGDDGASVNKTLVADAAGDLFGTTNGGGIQNGGTVFELVKTASGFAPVITVVVFDLKHGLYPTDGLVFDAAGNLFGTTGNGPNGAGFIYELTKAQIAAVPVTVSVTNIVPTPPQLTIAGEQANTTTVTLSGTIDTTNSGLTISIYDGKTLLGTTVANASGVWLLNVIVSAAGVHTLTATASNSAGTATSTSVVDLVDASTSLSGGVGIVLFAGTSDSVSLSASNGSAFKVLGSNGTVNLAAAQAIVNGGADTINLDGSTSDGVSLTGTANAWDAITGSHGTIDFAGAQASVTGGGNTIDFTRGAGNVVGLYASGGVWNSVSGAVAGTIYLTGAQAAVTGGGNTISFAGGTGNVVGLHDTGGTWDRVWAPGGETIYLTNAQAAVTGGGNTISFAGGTGNVAGLHDTGGNWDSIWAPGGETIYLTNAQAAVTGGGNIISFAGGTGNAVGLYNTGGAWDSIWAPGGDTIYLTSAQAAVSGGNNTISFAGGTGNVVGLYNTGGNWDRIWAPGGETIYLASAQAAVTGGGNAISFAGGTGNVVGLYNTAGSADTIWTASGGTVYFTSAQASVTGGATEISFAGGSGNVATLKDTGASADSVWASNGTLNLASAQANITGNGDVMNFTGSSVANLNGTNQLLAFGAGIGDYDVITGWSSTDTLQMSASNFEDWAHLMNSGDMAQVGADTVITIDASDSIKLVGVTASSLTSAQFHFA